MTEQAIITMTIVLGGVWGGFALLLTYALRRESRKRIREEENTAPGNDSTPKEHE